MSNNINHLLKKAQVLFDSENYVACEKLLLKIRHETPNNAHALNLLGGIELSKKNFSNAEKFFLNAIQIDPNNATYYYSLGLVYHQLQLLDRAINCYEKSISVNPKMAHAHTNLSIVLRMNKRYDLAVQHAENARKLAPNNSDVNNNLGVAYEYFGDYSNALKYYEKAKKINPNSIDVLKNIAAIYAVHDQKDKAIACYRKIQYLKPSYGEAYRSLVGLKKYTSEDDPDALLIKEKLHQSELSESDRASFLFALGKIYDDSRSYDKAFRAWQEANDIIDSHIKFDMSTLSTYVDTHIATFTKDFFASRTNFGRSEKMPIFILGMPRSGTSLVETILASHSLVCGAGELDWFDQLASALPNIADKGNKTAYPECVTNVDENTISKLGEKYIDYLTMLSHDAPYVINKLPANFQRLGMIRLLFPNAKVIHCKRNPMDTCLSIYSKLFPGNLPWSYNLQKLGEYYSEYDRLMQHWHTVIPGNYILDIQYEDLINNQKTITRDLLNFIGLPWEDSCLEYYKNKRGVRTASSQQVKQPLYNSSVERWKNYEKQLTPLMETISKVSEQKK